MIPIPGTRRRDNFDANLRTARTPLGLHLVTRLPEALRLGIDQGERYSPVMIEKLDE